MRLFLVVVAVAALFMVAVAASGLLAPGAAPANRSEGVGADEVVGAGMVRYVALGDSYTIGHAVAESERWPDQLAAKLTESGVAVQVVANLAVSGWTALDAQEREVPLLAGAEPGFVTVQIGVNDWVQGVPEAVFRQRFAELLDAVRAAAPGAWVLVVTIPDFSATPAGARYAGGRDATKGIAGFNAIIEDEARARGIAVADVFGVSQVARNRADFVAVDGLHPSGTQYAAWVEVILPVARRALEA